MAGGFGDWGKEQGFEEGLYECADIICQRVYEASVLNVIPSLQRFFKGFGQLHAQLQQAY